MIWSDFLIPFVLLVSGVVALIFLSVVILRPLWGFMTLVDFWVGSSVRRTEERLSRLGNLAGGSLGVDVEWVDLFIFEPSTPARIVKLDRALMERVYQLNLRVVESMIGVFGQDVAQLEHISTLPDLLDDRRAILCSISEASRAIHSIRSRRQSRGKETPKWALKEFRNKLDNLKSDLKSNELAIVKVVKTVKSSAIRFSTDSVVDELIH